MNSPSSNQFLVVYPAQTIAANPSQCWNWFQAAHQHPDRGEPSLLAGITANCSAPTLFNARQVYVAGLSAGGAMAMILGVSYPEIYAAIGVHSGLAYGAAHDLPSAFAAMRHGRGSGRPRSAALVPPWKQAPNSSPRSCFMGIAIPPSSPQCGSGAGALGAALRGRRARHGGRDESARDGEPGTSARRTGLHPRPPSRCQRSYRPGALAGPEAGHAWFGGSPDGSFTDPQGPDASQA